MFWLILTTSWEQDFPILLKTLLRDKCFVSNTNSSKPTKAVSPVVKTSRRRTQAYGTWAAEGAKTAGRDCRD